MGLMADLVERIWRSCWRNLSEGGWTDRRLHRVGKRNDNDQEIPFQSEKIKEIGRAHV